MGIYIIISGSPTDEGSGVWLIHETEQRWDKGKKKKKFHVSHREDEGVGIGQMEADRDPREFCN